MKIIDLSGHRSFSYIKKHKTMTMFDLNNTKRLLDMYINATGTCCSILDMEGESLYEGNSELNKGCSFCPMVYTMIGKNLRCKEVHKYGIYQSERFKGKYTFFCPLGLGHWASPLMVDNKMQAAFMGGPVLLYDREEFYSDVTVKYKISGDDEIKLRDYINTLPLVDHTRLTSLSEMLYILSKQISDKETEAYLTQRNEVEKINENINEYLPYLKTMGGNDEIEDYPIELERDLLRTISNGDKPNAKKILNDILGHIFFSSANNYELIKARVLELVVLLSRAALEGGATTEEIFGLNFKYLSEIHNFRTVDQLAIWLSKIMNRFSDCVFDLKDVKHVDVIYRALEYIKKNYMNKISLHDVAYVSNISPSYFSKVFKEEMGTNFNNYLNDVRVNSAKRLLVDDSVPLVDVAFMTGFEDQSYFSKVFKKITGISPGKYRESMGIILTEKTV